MRQGEARRARAYVTLVKFEQSVVLSLARAITPRHSQLSWTELAERGETNERSFFKTESPTANPEKILVLSIARIMHAAGYASGPGS